MPPSAFKKYLLQKSEETVIYKQDADQRYMACVLFSVPDLSGKNEIVENVQKSIKI